MGIGFVCACVSGNDPRSEVTKESQAAAAASIVASSSQGLAGCATLEDAATARRKWSCENLKAAAGDELRARALCVPPELRDGCAGFNINIRNSNLQFRFEFLKAAVKRVPDAFQVQDEPYAPRRKVDGKQLHVFYQITNPYPSPYEVPVPDAFSATTSDNSIYSMPGTRQGWRGGDRIHSTALKTAGRTIGWTDTTRNPIGFAANQRHAFELTFPPFTPSISAIEILELPLLRAGRVDAVYAIPIIDLAPLQLIGIRVSRARQ